MLFATAEELERKKLAQATGLVDNRTTQEAAESLVLPPVPSSTMPDAPLTPSQQARERYGTGGSMLRRLGNLFTGGLFDEQIIPEMSSQSRANYKADMGVYRDLTKDQMKVGMLNEQAAPWRSMLEDDDKGNDMQALQRLSVLQPDVYGPVLREMGIQQFAPPAATYTEGKFQYDPSYDNGEGKAPGRYFLGRQANDGTYKKDYQGEGFIPKSFKWSPDAREKAIGDVDAKIATSDQHLSELSTLGESMDKIGPDKWTAGIQGKLGEEWKDLTGAQDNVTMVRTQYRRIRNALAVQNLPPGVASDKDIAMVLEGFPSDFSDFDHLREYISAMERAEKKLNSYYNYESNYISSKDTRVGFNNAWKADQDSVFGTVDKDPNFEAEFNRIWGE